VTFIKLRAFFVPLALTCVYAFVRRMTRTRAEAGAAFAAMLLFALLNFPVWEQDSVIPFVRRGAIASGILVPALMVLIIAATRRTDDLAQARVRAVALSLAPLLLAASLATHSLDMFTLLCFAAAVCAVAFLGLDRRADRRASGALMLLLAVSATAFLAVQRSTVTSVTEYERARKIELRSDLRQMATDPRGAVAGPISEGARNLLGQVTSETVAGVVAIPVLTLAAVVFPASAAILAVAIVPLMLMFAMPAGYLLFQLLTSDSIRSSDGADHFLTFLGLVAVGLAAVAVAEILLHAVAARRGNVRALIGTSAIVLSVLCLAWVGEQAAVRKLVDLAVLRLRVLLLIDAAAAAVIIAIAAASHARFAPVRTTWAGLLAAGLIIPMPIANWSLHGAYTEGPRHSILAHLKQARSVPSVLNFPSYYERLKGATAPIPLAVMEDLQRIVPPRQVVLADPTYSCGLVVLLDAYCVNPARISGHFFLPAIRYFEVYVEASSIRPGAVSLDNGGEHPGENQEVHPFFNSTSSISERERRLLVDYNVTYILADPEHRDGIDAKLRHGGIDATIEANRDGYRLYRIATADHAAS